MPEQDSVAKVPEQTARNLVQQSRILREQATDLKQEAARLRAVIKKDRAKRRQK